MCVTARAFGFIPAFAFFLFCRNNRSAYAALSSRKIARLFQAFFFPWFSPELHRKSGPRISLHSLWDRFFHLKRMLGFLQESAHQAPSRLQNYEEIRGPSGMLLFVSSPFAF